MGNVVIQETRHNHATIQVVHGDITLEAVDAIVNAANSRLQHGGGIAGAIVRRGGRVIQEESNRIGFVPVGGAASTSGGRLAAKYVIHAVGPMWGQGQEPRKLASAVRSALDEAVKLSVNSISIPAISSGIFGYPKEAACKVIVDTVISYVLDNPNAPKTIRLCAIDQQTVNAFVKALDRS